MTLLKLKGWNLARDHGSLHYVFFFCYLGIIWVVSYKNDVECHLEKLLESEKKDGQLLAKCVEELMKRGGGGLIFSKKLMHLEEL
jgi:hypothetical protein